MGVPGACSETPRLEIQQKTWTDRLHDVTLDQTWTLDARELIWLAYYIFVFFSLWSYRGSTHFTHFGTLERTCAKTCRISLRSALWWSPVATLGVTIVAVLCGVQVNMLGSPFKQLQQWSRYLTYCRKLQFEEGKGPLTLVMVQQLQDESLWLCNILTGVLC